MAEKTPQQNVEEFNKVIRKLQRLQLGNNSLNVSANERNVTVGYDPFHDHASVTAYREVPTLLDGFEKQNDAISKWEEFMVESDKVLKRGKDLRVFLYTFRGLSATLPVAPSGAIDVDDNATPEQKEIAAQMRRQAVLDAKTVKERNFQILEPYMCRLRDLQDFNEALGNSLHTFVDQFTLFTQNNKREVVPSQIKERAVELVDVLVQLDNLKDMKASILNDFSLFKRCLKGIEDDTDPDKVEEYNQMVKTLGMFLADPSNPKSIMFQKTRQRIQGVEHYDIALVTLCEFCRKRIKHSLYLTSDEKHMYLRVIPHLFLLIDEHQTENQELSGRAAVNIFKHKKLNTSDYKLICKQYPVVPLFRDMSVNLIEILKRCYHFPAGSEHKWACDQDSDGRDIMPSEYDLQQHWARTRVAYDEFVALWLTFMKSVRLKVDQNVPPEKIAMDPVTNETDSISVGQRMSETVLSGMRLLSKWSTRIKNHITWKYTHPQDGAATPPDERDRYQPYRDAVKNNLSRTELTVLTDTIGLTKSLAALMLQEESTVVAVLTATMYKDIQTFNQVHLRQALYFAQSKHRKHTLELLEALRDTMADWPSGAKPEHHVKYLDPRKSGAGNLLRRVAVPTETQLYVYRSLMDLLVDDNSEAMNSGSLIRSRDISKDTEQLVDAHRERAFFYPYLLGFAKCIDSFKDMGDLLFREYYLEVTRCVQFPLRLSLPYILVDHILTRRSHLSTVDNLLMILDIYNDAATRVLYEMKKQFMFNEIEAEVQIVFEQLVLNLSDETYAYHKDRAAYDALPKEVKAALSKKSKTAVPATLRHLDVALSQRTVELLGRSLDLHVILSKKLQAHLVQDLKAIVARFELSRLTEVMEIDILLKIVRSTHANLVNAGLELDDFQDLFNRHVQRVGVFSFQDSMVLRVQDAMFSDLTVWFAFNETSQQFVLTDEEAADAGEFVWKEKKPRAKKPFYLFGSGPVNPDNAETRQTRLFAKAHERWLKQFTGYFGAEHCRAIINVVGISHLPIVIRSCEQRLHECIDETLWDFVDMLGSKPEGDDGDDGDEHQGIQGFPMWELPKTSTTVNMSTDMNFRRLEVNAQHVLSRWNKLNLVIVMQTFREIGNIIALLRLIQRSLDQEELHMYMLSAPFLQQPATKERTVADDINAGEDDTILESACEDVLRRYNDSPDGVMGPHIGYLGRYCENAVNAYAPLDQNALILQPILDGISTLLGTADYDHWHGDVVGNPNATMAMDARPQRQYHRIWSMLSFIFCMKPLEAMDMPSFKNKFGDGFLWGGLTLLHLLGQRQRFDILNLSKFLLELKDFEDSWQDPAKVTKEGQQVFLSVGGKQVMGGQDPDIREFFARSRHLLKTTEHILDSLESSVRPPDMVSTVQFHPDGSVITGDGTKKQSAAMNRRSSLAVASPKAVQIDAGPPKAAVPSAPKPLPSSSASAPPAPKTKPPSVHKPAVPKAKAPPVPQTKAPPVTRPPVPSTKAPPVPKTAAPPPPKTAAPPVPKQPAPAVPKTNAPPPPKSKAPPPPKSAPPQKQKEVFRVAKHKYKGFDEDELTFAKGDSIKIVGKGEDEGWLVGEIRGKRGLVPENYLRPI